MLTLTKQGNLIKLEFTSGEVYYVKPDTNIFTRPSENKIHIVNEAYDVAHFRLSPTDINGRPSDDLDDVAQWLSETYFVGQTLQATGDIDLGDVTIINGSGANAVNIQDGGNSITVDGTVSINGDSVGLAKDTTLQTLINNTPSSLVTEQFDYKQIVYSGSDIDYISYKSGGVGGTEVARVTFSYDIDGNITGMAKT